jgi:hypothetical protein
MIAQRPKNSFNILDTRRKMIGHFVSHCDPTTNERKFMYDGSINYEMGADQPTNLEGYQIIDSISLDEESPLKVNLQSFSDLHKAIIQKTTVPRKKSSTFTFI